MLEINLMNLPNLRIFLSLILCLLNSSGKATNNYNRKGFEPFTLYRFIQFGKNHM